MDVRETIREFISNNFLRGDESGTFDDDDSFLENGMIDSVGIVELVVFIEETFGFRVEDEEIIPANFDSVNQLIVYVRSKLTSNNS